jgi:hypothetical protein
MKFSVLTVVSYCHLLSGAHFAKFSFFSLPLFVFQRKVKDKVTPLIKTRLKCVFGRVSTQKFFAWGWNRLKTTVPLVTLSDILRKFTGLF